MIRGVQEVREGVGVGENSTVGGLHILGFKWRLPDKKRVNDDTRGPNVYFVRVSVFTL